MVYLKGVLDEGSVAAQRRTWQHTHPSTSQSSPNGYPLLKIQLLLHANEGLRRNLHAWKPVDF
jgi:hypothetical protein